MVCGGCCHDYANQKLILAEGISARANVEFTIVHEEARVKDDRTHQISIYKEGQLGEKLRRGRSQRMLRRGDRRGVCRWHRQGAL
jgi:hypothetical protein